MSGRATGRERGKHGYATSGRLMDCFMADLAFLGLEMKLEFESGAAMPVAVFEKRDSDGSFKGFHFARQAPDGLYSHKFGRAGEPIIIGENPQVRGYSLIDVVGVTKG